jgi:hypothetical protein
MSSLARLLAWNLNQANVRIRLSILVVIVVALPGPGVLHGR